MGSILKFDETLLPPKSKFFSKLNDSGISDEDYLQATKVWNEFKVRNMEDRLPRSLSQISCFVAHRRL